MGIADARYVSLTTFRKTGVAVPTPVWAVPLPDGRLGVWTAPDAGKVKRLAHTPAVEVTACDVRGRIKPGAQVHTGSAIVVDDGPEVGQVQSALRRKYGLQGVIAGIGARVKGAVKRERFTVVVITLD